MEEAILYRLGANFTSNRSGSPLEAVKYAKLLIQYHGLGEQKLNTLYHGDMKVSLSFHLC